ncbi:TlpA disulfide reductase family protein [Paludibaculum fermentans]|uniref:TlpA family protein disulfide reductase n=1 Tax=Paludibaculum fermentans TaxID=1473598 RepID=A0A7S7NT33_PALFE|nr:TlpA disulfide reductase family protein [Paludibaculum fermentans]QOY89328.1 TlpA family protein disulfide reductase [Paludibaculum fermentans]
MRLLSATLLAALCLSSAAVAETLPRPAGEIKFIAHTGDTITLSALKGKVVVLEFLLTTCPHCQDTARKLAGLQKEFGPKGLQVIGLAIDENAGQNITGFVAKSGANFPLGVYDYMKSRAYLQIPDVMRMSMPHIAIIDRKGMIQVHHGAEEPWMADAAVEANLRADITRLLGPAPAAKPAPKKKS